MGGELVLQALRRILAALRRLGLEPVLVGGLGIQAWGRIRQTQDVDLLVLTGESDRESLFRAAAEEGLAADPVKPIVALEGTAILRFAYADPKFGVLVRVDLIEAGVGFLVEVAHRARRVHLFGEDLRVATCEDLILMKLSAGRAIDLADAAELLRMNRETLEPSYLQSTARRLGREDDLRRCEEESRREP